MLVGIHLFSYFNTLKREKFVSHPVVGERSPSVGKCLAPPLTRRRIGIEIRFYLSHDFDQANFNVVSTSNSCNKINVES